MQYLVTSQINPCNFLYPLAMNPAGAELYPAPEASGGTVDAYRASGCKTGVKQIPRRHTCFRISPPLSVMAEFDRFEKWNFLRKGIG